MPNTENLPLCKYGEKCYRKNPQHLEEYYHPEKKTDNVKAVPKNELKRQKSKDSPEPVSKKKASIESFFRKNTETQESPQLVASTENYSSDDEELFDAAEKLEKSIATIAEGEQEPEHSSSAPLVLSPSTSSSCRTTELMKSEDDEPVCGERELIKKKCLVDMPEDFYQFYEFCTMINPKNPTGALEPSLGYTLVGPYDILSGKHRTMAKKVNYLLHYRYYYDPPEMLTVVKGDNKTQFHLGYFRDDPSEMPAFVASNCAGVDCIIKPRGGNMFSAICACIDERIKDDPSTKSSLTALRNKLTSWANGNNISLEIRSKAMKERDKRVVSKSFHGAGIVVPVDENEVGYRPLPETPANLKKMLKKIVDSASVEERDKNSDELMEMITLVQFANDECDYGEGLELGLDLFSYGSELFHKPILLLLPLAYRLLHRPAYATIIEDHLACRTKSWHVSQLD